MSRPSSVLCPSCGTLVGVKDPQCLSCGRRNPGMWGFAHVLRSVGDDMGFATVVMWACGALYLASLAADFEGLTAGGLLSFLSPSVESLFLFGASGAVPGLRLRALVDRPERGLAARGCPPHPLQHDVGAGPRPADRAALRPGPHGDHLHGGGGLAASCAEQPGRRLPALPPALPRAEPAFTVGASAPIFGLIGALLHYGRRGGSSYIGQQAKSLAITMLIFGFIMPGIDNWAHLGGLGGGWLAAKVLDPLKPERGDHVLVAFACLALSLLSVGFSVVHGLTLFRQ